LELLRELLVLCDVETDALLLVELDALRELDVELLVL
jgi:hypothetical protein